MTTMDAPQTIEGVHPRESSFPRDAAYPLRMKDLCAETGLPRQAIHFYIQQGLLEPGQTLIFTDKTDIWPFTLTVTNPPPAVPSAVSWETVCWNFCISS